MPPNDIFLKVYMQSRDNRFSGNNSATVNVSIMLQVTNSIAESKAKANKDFEKPCTFLRSFDVEKNSSSWLEFDITNLLAKYKDAARERFFVGIILKFDVNCKLGERLPMKIIHSIHLSAQNTLGKRMSVFQPFLVIATGNIQRAVEASSRVPSLDLSVEQPERTKRNARDHICLVENFSVTFSALGIRRIIIPLSLNINQCVGGCSINYAPAIETITTNHARLMISATATYNENTPLLNPSPPKDPCCSPISYNGTYLVVGTRYSLKMIQEKNIIVTKCGCR